jgi:hypothetical protein
MALAAHNFTIQDDAGNIVTDVQIEVRLDTVGTPLVALFSDRDGEDSLGNPFEAATGTGRFHVAGGAYRIRAFKDGFEATQRYVGIGTAQESDFEDVVDAVEGSLDLVSLIETTSPDDKETALQLMPFLGAIVKRLPQADGTAIGNMTGQGGLAAAFDDAVSKGVGFCAGASSGTRAFIGKTLASASVIEKVALWGANNDGFIQSADPEITWNVRAKNGDAPTNDDAGAVDGEIIGTLTFDDTADESAGRDIDCFNGAEWEHVWAECESLNEGGKRVAQMAIYTRIPTGIFRKSAQVRAAADPILVTDAVPSVGGQPFRFDGLSIDTAAWNQIVAGINSGDLIQLRCPSGITNIDAALDAFARPSVAGMGGFELVGAGRAQSQIRMVSDTVGRFFTFGTALLSCDRWRIANLSLRQNNINALIANMVAASAAPDDGTSRAYLPLDMVNGNDGVLEHLYLQTTAGICGFGDKVTEPTAARNIRIFRCRGSTPTTCPTALFQIESSNGIKIHDVKHGMISGQTSDSRLWVAHLRPGPPHIDPFNMESCEFNAGGGSSNQALKGVVLDVGSDPDGDIHNAWFTDIVADHIKESCVELRVKSGTTGNRRLNNIFFNGCRLTGDDGHCVIVDHQGDADIPLRFQFNGGLLQNWGAPEGGGNGVPIVVFKAANSPRIEGKFIGVELSQTTNGLVTGDHAAAILVEDRVDGVMVQGCNIRANAQPDGPPKISYLVEFEGDARDWNITGNDAKLATVADVKTDTLGAGSLGRMIIGDNNSRQKSPLCSVVTTDDSTTTLGTIVLENNRVYAVECLVVARRTDNAGQAWWKLTAGAFRQAGGNATLSGSAADTPNSGHATWTAVLNASGTALNIRVTGANSQTINWGVHALKVSEVS